MSIRIMLRRILTISAGLTARWNFSAVHVRENIAFPEFLSTRLTGGWKNTRKSAVSLLLQRIFTVIRNPENRWRKGLTMNPLLLNSGNGTWGMRSGC